MKINKLIKLFSLLFFIMISSCEDGDKDNLDDFIKIGAFPKFEKENPPSTVGVSDINDLVYSFEIIDANNTISLYDLDLYAVIGGVQTETFDVNEFTNFPISQSFTSNDLANIIGIDVNDIGFGDSFFFTATATNKEGEVYGGTERLDFDNNGDDDPQNFELIGQGNTDDLLDEDGYRQAFEFDFIILCPDPFTADDLVGMWQITFDPFGTFIDDGIFEVIAGPGINQITLLDPFGHPDPDNGGAPFNIIVDFDPDTGEATVAKQAAWHCDNFGCGFGQARIEGGGFIFECVELMKFNFEHTVDLGSFGTFPMDMQKLP